MSDDIERRRFDAEGFFAALDSQRQARQQTWKDVAGEAGVSASTLTRMSQGKRPDVDTLAALANWGGLSVNDYIETSEQPSERESLAAISTYIRRDRNLTPDAAAALEEVVRSTYRRLRRPGPAV